MQKRRIQHCIRVGCVFLLMLGIRVSLIAESSSEDADAAIQKHRKGKLVIKAPPGTRITVEQVRHESWFGAALANQVFSDRMPSVEREKYLAVFLTNFNSAVTENALKWHDMEPRRGMVNYSTVDAIL